MSNQKLYFGDTLHAVSESLGLDFQHDNTQQVTITQGECYQCGAKIYGSPDSQCPKCGKVNNTTIQQVSRLPRSVETVATNIETRFDATAQMLISTAVKLEERASDLREKAKWLLEQRMLAKEVREAVSFEQTSFEEVQSLALVHVGMRPENGGDDG